MNDNLINNKLDTLIMESMKDHNEIRTRTLRLMKAAFLEAQKAPGATELDETKEVQILQKMVKQREDARQQYIDANRIELAKNEFEEIQIIQEFLPKPITKNEIEEAFEFVYRINADAIQPIRANMGKYIHEIKKQLPLADGKLIAEVVQKKLV